MALWKKVQTLDETSLVAVDKYYDENFPIEVRNLFATFIEDEVFGKQLDADNPNHFPLICNFINSLIEQIDTRIKTVDVDPFYIRQKLSSAADKFKRNFGSNQLGLFRTIKACLEMENSLAAPENFRPYERDEILDNCKFMKDQISQRDAVLQNLDHKQSDFESDFERRNECDAILNKLKVEANGGLYTEQHRIMESNCKAKKEDVEKKLQQTINEIITWTKNLEENLNKDMKSITLLSTQILNNVVLWKYQQQEVANGGTGTLKLDKVQQWCEELAEIIWSTKEQIRKIERIKLVNPVFKNYKDKLQADTVPELNINILSLLRNLLQEAFVVEEQPPQVMKQSTKFPTPVTIRHLAGHKLNCHMMTATVSVRLIEEVMAKKLKDPNCVITDRGGISIGSRSLEYNKDARNYSTTFKNCQLKNFRRSEKKGVGLERVMEDKFCLYFETILTVGEMKFKIWTISLPSVVISHGSQEAQAVATITWDNGFGEINREPFAVPCKVPWANLSVVLSQKFFSCTGRELNLEHLTTLEKKLFRGGSSSEFVTWTEFCKDNMNGTNFSFWSWCYEIIKLIEKCLKGPWCDGSIMGIIERDTAENMLRTCAPGTFLARYSDSRLGAISITWIHSDGKVYSVNPLTKTDLATKGFADTIMDLDKLQYLYPGIPKADAFGKHRKPATATLSASPINPYVPIKTDLDVPGNMNCASPLPDNGNNQWSYPHSPARSSFSECSDFMATLSMDVEPQPSGFMQDQFPEFLITFPPNVTNNVPSPLNGTTEHYLQNNNLSSEDDDMNDDGIVQDVLKVFQNGISSSPIMNTNDMMNFTQL